MPINTTTLVLSAVAEKAAGVPLQKALPIALFASTLRPMTGLVFALLLGKSALGSSPSGTTTTAPATSGTSGSNTRSGGTTTSGSTTTTPTHAPNITSLSLVGKELHITGENFGRRMNAVTVKFSWPVGSPQMTTETMPLARHGAKLKDDLITIPMNDLPKAAASSNVAVVVMVKGVSSNSKEIDL